MPQPSTIGQQLTRYLRTLAGELPAGGYFDVRCYHRGPGVGDMWRAMIPADELDRAGATIRQRARAGDVYVGVALRVNPEFGGASAIESSHLAFVEIDTADASIRLGEFHHQPTMLLSSGTLGHLHAYWQLTRSLPNPELEATNRKLAHHLGGDLASVDAARVLRPPATYNRKRSPVRPVALIAHEATVAYDPDVLVDGLNDPQPRIPHRPARSWRPVSRLDARLRAIPTVEYVRALTGLEPNRSGKICCPFHPDHTPSLQLYDAGTWYCFGCRQGGSLYQFAALLWGMQSRPGSQRQLRQALADTLGIARVRS